MRAVITLSSPGLSSKTELSENSKSNHQLIKIQFDYAEAKKFLRNLKRLKKILLSWLN